MLGQASVIGAGAAGGYNIVGPAGAVPYAPGTATAIPTRVYVTPQQAAPAAATVIENYAGNVGAAVATDAGAIVSAVEQPLSSLANFITTALVLVAAIVILPKLLQK